MLFDQLPEPIDLELDLANRVLYWTDRGDRPRGNTVNRAAIDRKAVPEILITHLMEGIGIALDVPQRLSAPRIASAGCGLLDLGLPVMTGIEVARELRRQRETANAWVVALTGWGQPEDRRQTRRGRDSITT